MPKITRQQQRLLSMTPKEKTTRNLFLIESAKKRLDELYNLEDKAVARLKEVRKRIDVLKRSLSILGVAVNTRLPFLDEYDHNTLDRLRNAGPRGLTCRELMAYDHITWQAMNYRLRKLAKTSKVMKDEEGRWHVNEAQESDQEVESSNGPEADRSRARAESGGPSGGEEDSGQGPEEGP